jgi:hypothetical protein
MTMDTTPPELRKAKEMAADPRYAGIWWPTDEQIATARLGHSGAVLAVTSTLSAPAAVPIALGDGSLRRSKLVVLL